MGKNIRVTAVRTATLMAVLTLMSKLIGFVREIVLANFFGTSYIVDAYVMSNTILSTLFGGIFAAIATAYMPLFSKITEEKGQRLGNLFTSQIINILFILAVGISLIGYLFSDSIVNIFAMGFEGETANLCSFFVKFLFIYIAFSSTSSILGSYLQYQGIFLPQIISGYCVSLCIIIGIIISAHTNYYYLIFGTLAGHLLKCICLVYISKRKGYKHHLSLAIGDKARELIGLAFPVFLGSYISYINFFVDKTLASRLAEGSIAALNYASLINNMIINMTATILVTIVYPKLTQAYSMSDHSRFNSLLQQGFNIIIIIGTPCAMGAVAYSQKIVQVIYERGAFGEGATVITGNIFMYYAIGMFFLGINELLVRAYYSMHDMRQPVAFAAGSVAANIFLSIILVKYMGQNGIALATSIAAAVNTLFLTAGLLKKPGNISVIQSKVKLMKIVIAAMISVLASYVVYWLVIHYMEKLIFIRLLQLLIAVLTAAAVYLLALKCFKIEEIKLIRKMF